MKWRAQNLSLREQASLMLQTSKTRSSSPPKKLDLNKNRYSALKRITPGKGENEPNETSPKNWRWCCQNREKAKTSHVMQNWVASIKSVTNIIHSTKYVTKYVTKRWKITNGEVVVGATGGGGLSTSRRRRSGDRRLGSEQPLNEETHHSNLGTGLGKLVHVFGDHYQVQQRNLAMEICRVWNI